MLSKLKSILRSEQSFLAGLLCLVGLASFQLGQVSVQDSFVSGESLEHNAGIIFTDAPEQAIQRNVVKVVASSGGTKYHKLDCPGADNIKESNKVYFDSIEQAKAAGYTPATNCTF